MTPIELAVVMPIYNEAPNIETVLGEWMGCFGLLDVPYRVLALNDGSCDSTAAVLNTLQNCHSAQMRVINKSNSGHGQTCRAGYEMAIEESAPWIFQIDSDGQCDPQFFPQFWNSRNQHDCIFGERKTRDDGMARVFVSFCCRILVWIWTGAYLQDPNVPYRLMRRDALQRALRIIPPDLDVQNIALSLALKRDPTVRWHLIPIHFRDRQGGTNSIDLRKIVSMGWQMLRDLKRVR